MKSIKIFVSHRIDIDSFQIPNPIFVNVLCGAYRPHKDNGLIGDNTGDNISELQPYFSELTVQYWAWKNQDADYYGLCHYRRLFGDLDRIADKLQQVDVDAVLPFPTLCEHSVFEDYLFKHIPTVWQPMMDVLRELSPEYYMAAEKIFKGRVFYASNMLILRREVLDALCQFIITPAGVWITTGMIVYKNGIKTIMHQGCFEYLSRRYYRIIKSTY